ncbi:hypothetical protein [Pararhizobium sp.]|uniref:hypothetical protein n=1 Tax=Pararhizobium sp. TaxID=1977563 RepID=UPI002715C1EE|nr:hypothetical protein [Pararhizobium sp.]MDO9417094.1 hypothetical protein [Pararhizobium sp.]
MGKFTDDPVRLIAKSDVALLQFEDAIRLFLERRYISAITLAGAADAIFCGIIEESGGKAPADMAWAEIEQLRSLGIRMAGTTTKKEAFKEWNATRNRLKHHDKEKDEPILEIFEIDQSYMWIERARHSAKILELEPANLFDLENRVIPWFF